MAMENSEIAFNDQQGEICSRYVCKIDPNPSKKHKGNGAVSQ